MLDPYTYRCPAGHPDPSRSARARRTWRSTSNAKCTTVAAVILETVVGTNGIIVPPDGYLQSIRRSATGTRSCSSATSLAGFGRTSKWFACAQLGRRPGHPHGRKGDQLGLRPARRDDRQRAGRAGLRGRFLAGGLTYSRPSARLRLRRRFDRGVPGGRNRRERPAQDTLSEALPALAAKHPSVGDVRGLGLFWGLELVKNRETREMLVPFNAGGDAAAVARGCGARRSVGPLPDDPLERHHGLPAADDHT